MCEKPYIGYYIEQKCNTSQEFSWNVNCIIKYHLLSAVTDYDLQFDPSNFRGKQYHMKFHLFLYGGLCHLKLHAKLFWCYMSWSWVIFIFLGKRIAIKKQNENTIKAYRGMIWCIWCRQIWEFVKVWTTFDVIRVYFKLQNLF